VSSASGFTNGFLAHYAITTNSMKLVHSLTHSLAFVVRNENVPIQLAQCSFPGLAISNAKIYFFSDKIYGCNFIQQHSETVMV